MIMSARLRHSLGLPALVLGLTTGLATGSVSPAHAQSDPPIQASMQLPSFAPIVEKVLPAVVNISVVEKSGASPADDEEQDDQAAPDQGPGPGMPGAGTPFDEFMRRFLQQQQPGHGVPAPMPHGQAMALGSGFIIDPSGYVVTNNHVVGGAEKVTVIFQDGSQHKAKIVGKDPRTDLALLKIETDHKLPYLEWDDSDKSKVGDWVLAVGNPFGLGGTVTNGIISARGRSVGDSSYVDYLQIDAAVNRGNSGGPTFDLAGHVIGINTAIYSPNGGNVGIAFSIPSDTAKTVIDELKSTGKVARGYLGVEVQEVTPSLASALGLPKPIGALVASVEPNSPGAKAGVEAGDLIEQFDGKPVTDMKTLPRLVGATAAGKSVDLTVLRHGKEVAIHATVGSLADGKLAANDQGDGTSQKGALGLSLAPLAPEARERLGLNDQTKGVLIARVQPDGPAASAGVEAGDVIERVNDQAVATPEAASTQIADAKKGGKPILLLIDRHGAERFVAIEQANGQG
jgi:serine protease Do